MTLRCWCWLGEWLPLYCIVSKLGETRLGSKKVFLENDHVPSPTTMVSDAYVALPGGESCSGAGAMAATTLGESSAL